MIREYVDAALRNAKYEMIEDEEPFYAEVEGLPGVWATGRTLEDCRTNLADAIEGWILLRVHEHLPIPSLDGITVSTPNHRDVA